MLLLLLLRFTRHNSRGYQRLLLLGLLLNGSMLRAQDADPTRHLEGFLLAARQNSPQLRDYNGQVAQIRLDSLRRRAQQRPQVTGTGVAVAAPIIGRGPTGEGGLGYDEAVSNGGNYGAFVGATQPLFNGRVLQNDYRILESQGQGLRNTGRLTALDLRRTVTDQFLTAYAAQQQWNFSTSLLKQLRQQDAVLRQLVNGGVFKQTQYLSYYLSVRSQEVAVQQARLTYRRELGTLRFLCGLTDTTLLQVEPPAPPTHRALAGLNSVTQRQYTLDSLRLLLDRQALDLSYRPRLNWVVDAGLQSSNPSPLYLGHSLGFSGGLQLSVPIFDGHQRQLGYDRLRISEDIRQGYRSFVSRQRRQQYDQLQGLARASDQLTASLREQLKVAGALVEAGRQQLGSGDMAILDFLQLISSYRTFQFSLAQAETERLRTLYALDYLSE